jgi:indolepyruvate ferredoxin oxidoreductase alpha subunit
VSAARAVLEEALDARGPRLRVVISDQECMLARQRRQRAAVAAAVQSGRPAPQARFGVDEEVCTGDHACMRLSGCPSLTLRRGGDPLKDGPTAFVDANCVDCGLCGAAAMANRLCPSFYRAEVLRNPSPWRRLRSSASERLLAWMGA